jgi:hypothetical protein
VGCAFWELSEANSSDEIHSSFSKVKMFSWNRYEKGKSWTKQSTMKANTSGVFSEVRLFGAYTQEAARIIDTDYTTYAVVYRCKIDESWESLLDGIQDQIQIFTRSGTLDSSTNASISNTLTSLMPNFDQSRLETIQTTNCAALSYYS